MEPILVPKPPKEAFNKDRLISDLVRHQVEHFKHVEESLPADIRAKIPQHAIVTENDAARYIHVMTTYLLSRPRTEQPARKAFAAKPLTPIRPRRPLTLAATATPVLKKSTAKEKAPAKKETAAAQKTRSIEAKARKTSTKRK
jgi:hypothetical protein